MNVFIRLSENTTCQIWPCLTLDELAGSSGIHQLHRSLFMDEVSNVTFFSFNETHVTYHVLISDPSAFVMVTDCKNINITGMVINIGSGDSKNLRDLALCISIPIICIKKY